MQNGFVEKVLKACNQLKFAGLTPTNTAKMEYTTSIHVCIGKGALQNWEQTG